MKNKLKLVLWSKSLQLPKDYDDLEFDYYTLEYRDYGGLSGLSGLSGHSGYFGNTPPYYSGNIISTTTITTYTDYDSIISDYYLTLFLNNKKIKEIRCFKN